jgi:hypothetical protein
VSLDQGLSMSSDRRLEGPDPAKANLEITRREGYIEVDFAGEFSPAAAMKVVDAMVGACAEAACPKILLDCRRMRGTISVIERFDMAEYGARVIPSRIKVAMLGRKDQILPDRFFESAAVSRGVHVQVFTREEEATGWL